MNGIPRLTTGDLSFTFLGGPRDGQRIVALRGHYFMSCVMLWRISNGGEVGQEFAVSSGLPFRRVRIAHGRGQAGRLMPSHRYEVLSNLEVGGHVWIECRYVGCR